MVTSEQIEQLTEDYITKNPTVKPRFILMDKNSLEKFSQKARPKERIVINPPLAEDAKITQMWLHPALILDILSVDTDKFLLEIVG